MKAPRRRVVVFDLGGVLLEWNPRHLYRKLFAGDDAAMEAFLGSVCTEAWNERQDAGRSFADGVAELLPKYPQHARLIEAFGARFGEMIPGAIEDSVAVLHELKRAGVPVYALTTGRRKRSHRSGSASRSSRSSTASSCPATKA